MKNAPGTPTAYQDVATSGLVRGTGIESQDIASMTDKMVRHREGVTDGGTTGLTEAVAGADYRLNGRIISLDARTADGIVERYMQIVFRMTDLENGIVVWTNRQPTLGEVE